MNRQRASNIDPYVREARLREFIQPIRLAWQDDELRTASSSFEGFCRLLGLESVDSYMARKQAYQLQDWSAVHLDNEGKKIQEDMTRKFQVVFYRLVNASNS